MTKGAIGDLEIAEIEIEGLDSEFLEGIENPIFD